MEIIVRDWKLLGEVAALNIREDGIALDRRIQLTRLLTTARMLSSTMFEVVEQELAPIKPKQFAPEPGQAGTLTLERLRSQVPETKTEIDWGMQVDMETYEHCEKVEGVQTLLDLEERQRQEEKSEGWEIRTDLNLAFMHDWRVNESPTLGLHALDDLLDLNVAVGEDNELKILDHWVRLNKFNMSLCGSTVADMQPIVAWQTLKRLAHSFSSGWTVFLNPKARYLFVFQRYACSPEQAYRIIDLLERDHISSAVVLLDLLSKPARSEK